MIDLLTHPIILECIDRGLTLEVSKGQIKLDGFYKSGSVLLKIDHLGNLIAESRYSQVDKIESFRDLVQLNYDWWENSRKRYDGWKVPDSAWCDFLIEFEFVQKSVVQIIQYNSINKG